MQGRLAACEGLDPRAGEVGGPAAGAVSREATYSGQLPTGVEDLASPGRSDGAAVSKRYAPDCHPIIGDVARELDHRAPASLTEIECRLPPSSAYRHGVAHYQDSLVPVACDAVRVFASAADYPCRS